MPATLETQSRVVPLLDGALDWIAGRLEDFGPDAPASRRAGGSGPAARKPLAELALACAWLRRSPRARADPRLGAAVSFVSEAMAQPALADRLLRDPDELPALVLLTAALHACGVRVETARRRQVQRLVDDSRLAARCDGALARLELRHVLDLGGFAHRLPPAGRLFAATPAARPLDPLHLSSADGYGVTHAVFYAADLGRSPAAIGPRAAARVRALVRDLLGMRLHAGDWDLAGELAVSARCLGGLDSPLEPLALERIGAAQRPDGSIPGRTFRQRHLDQLDESERRSYKFARCYHPTLVAALAAAG